MRFLTMVRTRKDGAGPPPAALMQGIAALGADAAKAGVLVETGGLLSIERGARVRVSGTDLTVLDGPFTEAKELVGGYAVYDVATKADVIAWTRRFMDIHITHWPGWEGETEIREIMTPRSRT